MDRENDSKVHEELCGEITSFIELTQAEAENEDFESLYGKILKVFCEEPEDEPDHGIGNLALLDQGTNKSYKNAVFAVKRQRLLELDQAGIFVPLCTRNVFLKCYSPQVDNPIFWTRRDRDKYAEAIVDVLVRFFHGKEAGL